MFKMLQINRFLIGELGDGKEINNTFTRNHEKGITLLMAEFDDTNLHSSRRSIQFRKVGLNLKISKAGMEI